MSRRFTRAELESFEGAAVDDLIDVRSETGESGKTPGTDLREGIRTLPVLLVLASGDRSPDSERLRTLLTGDLDDDERLAEALRLLRAHPAMDDAAAHLRRCADQARAIVGDQHWALINGDDKRTASLGEIEDAIHTIENL